VLERLAHGRITLPKQWAARHRKVTDILTSGDPYQIATLASELRRWDLERGLPDLDRQAYRRALRLLAGEISAVLTSRPARGPPDDGRGRRRRPELTRRDRTGPLTARFSGRRFACRSGPGAAAVGGPRPRAPASAARSRRRRSRRAAAGRPAGPAAASAANRAADGRASTGAAPPRWSPARHDDDARAGGAPARRAGAHAGPVAEGHHHAVGDLEAAPSPGEVGHLGRAAGGPRRRPRRAPRGARGRRRRRGVRGAASRAAAGTARA
jgi:hypothetical protein